MAINFDPFKFRGSQQAGDGIGSGGLRPAQASPWANLGANAGGDSAEIAGTLPTSGGQESPLGQGSGDPTLNRMNRYMQELTQLQGDMSVLKAMGYKI